MNRIILIIIIFNWLKIIGGNEPKKSNCSKVSVVFTTKYDNTKVKVYADDSLWFDKKITNKNVKVIEVADAIEITKIPKYLLIRVGKKHKKIILNDTTCFIYVKRKGLFNKLHIEETATQQKFR